MANIMIVGVQAFQTLIVPELVYVALMVVEISASTCTNITLSMMTIIIQRCWQTSIIPQASLFFRLDRLLYQQKIYTLGVSYMAQHRLQEVSR